LHLRAAARLLQRDRGARCEKSATRRTVTVDRSVPSRRWASERAKSRKLFEQALHFVDVARQRLRGSHRRAGDRPRRRVRCAGRIDTSIMVRCWIWAAPAGYAYRGTPWRSAPSPRRRGDVMTFAVVAAARAIRVMGAVGSAERCKKCGTRRRAP
jgi:hypothetical protein